MTSELAKLERSYDPSEHTFKKSLILPNSLKNLFKSTESQSAAKVLWLRLI